MAKPAHTRVTFTGMIGSGGAPVEDWSFNVNYPSSATGAAMPLNTIQGLAESARQSFYDHLRSNYGTDTILTNVRVAHVDDTGHVSRTVDGEYVQGDDATPVPGTQAKQPMPLQTALCVSLTTVRPGPTGKGRFFLPWPALSLDADDKRLPIIQAEQIRDRVGEFLHDLSTALGASPVVVSSKGYTTEVIGIKVGRVPDTMRSRREDNPEGYVVASLASFA